MIQPDFLFLADSDLHTVDNQASTVLRVRRLLVLALLLAACGTAADTTSSSVADGGSDGTTSAEVSDPTSTLGESEATTTSSLEGCPMEESDRPMAPDFTLALGDGGSYTLSDGCNPVYMVFWAEW